VEVNFLKELVSEPSREGTPLDLSANREELVSDMMVGGHLGHSNHEMTEFSILGQARSEDIRTATLEFQRKDFGLFKSLVDRVLWEAILKGKGV